MNEIREEESDIEMELTYICIYIDPAICGI